MTDLTNNTPSLDAAMTEVVMLFGNDSDNMNQITADQLRRAVNTAYEERWELARQEAGTARSLAFSMDARSVAHFVERAILGAIIQK